MYRPLLTTTLLVATYWVNYLSSSGQLGESMMYLREVFPFPYMPEGWTFAVARSAVYLTLGIWCIRSWTKNGQHNETNNNILPRFWCSSVLNIMRIYATAQERYVLSVVIIALLMKVLWNILAITTLFLKHKEFHWGSVVTRNAFGLYAGWITMATMIVGLSQIVYLAINNQRPLTIRRTILVLTLGIGTASYLFWKYRNGAQVVITLVALAGVMSSLWG